MDLYKNLAWFAGGVLFGSAGFKLLGSRDAKKVYVQATAAALRMKECAMVAATTVQENAADILAEAKDINAQRAARNLTQGALRKSLHLLLEADLALKGSRLDGRIILDELVAKLLLASREEPV